MGISSPNVIQSKGSNAFLEAFQTGAQMIQFNQALKLDREKAVMTARAQDADRMYGFIKDVVMPKWGSEGFLSMKESLLAHKLITPEDFDRLERAGMPFDEVAKTLARGIVMDPSKMPDIQKDDEQNEPIIKLLNMGQQQGGGTRETVTEETPEGKTVTTTEEEPIPPPEEPIDPNNEILKQAGKSNTPTPTEEIEPSQRIPDIIDRSTRPLGTHRPDDPISQTPPGIGAPLPMIASAGAADYARYFESVKPGGRTDYEQGSAPPKPSARSVRAGEKMESAVKTLSSVSEENTPAQTIQSMRDARRSIEDAKRLAGIPVNPTFKEQQQQLAKNLEDPQYVDKTLRFFGNGDVGKGAQVLLDFAAPGDPVRTARVAGDSAIEVQKIASNRQLMEAQFEAALAKAGATAQRQQFEAIRENFELEIAKINAQVSLMEMQSKQFGGLQDNIVAVMGQYGSPDEALKSPAFQEYYKTMMSASGTPVELQETLRPKRFVLLQILSGTRGQDVKDPATIRTMNAFLNSKPLFRQLLTEEVLEIVPALGTPAPETSDPREGKPAGTAYGEKVTQ